MNTRIHLKNTLIILLLMLSGSCEGNFRPVHAHRVVFSKKVEEGNRAEKQILILSDSHATNPLASHLLTSNSHSGERFSGAAIRPMQWEHWGIRILDWVLAKAHQNQLIIHLGDVANISCIGEFARFRDSMARISDISTNWYLAPGNHDSLLMGNWPIYAEPDNVPIQWNIECRGLSKTGSMDKKGFIHEYLSAKGWREFRGKKIRDRTCSDVDTQNSSVRARICRRDKPYDFFIIQEIDIDDNTTLFLIDTTQYRRLPRLKHGNIGGVRGGVGEGQIEEIRSWLTELDHSKRVIMAGHFPLDSLDDNSKESLADLLSEFHIVTYLSGHIHTATNARLHSLQENADEQFLEINLASTIGWPMEYAYLQVAPVQSATSITLQTRGIAVELQKECSAMEGFRKTDQSYLEYMNKTENPYKDQRNKMFRELFSDLNLDKTVSTCPAVSLNLNYYRDFELASGDTPDRCWPSNTREQITSYQRCQAIWASEAEDRHEGSKSSSFWSRVPIIHWYIHSHYDDPQPLHSVRLREPQEPLASWRWLVK